MILTQKKVHENTNCKKSGKTGGKFGYQDVTLSENYILELIKAEKIKHKIINVGNTMNQNV